MKKKTQVPISAYFLAAQLGNPHLAWDLVMMRGGLNPEWGLTSKESVERERESIASDPDQRKRSKKFTRVVIAIDWVVLRWGLYLFSWKILWAWLQFRCPREALLGPMHASVISVFAACPEDKLRILQLSNLNTTSTNASGGKGRHSFVVPRTVSRSSSSFSFVVSPFLSAPRHGAAACSSASCCWKRAHAASRKSPMIPADRLTDEWAFAQHNELHLRNTEE